MAVAGLCWDWQTAWKKVIIGLGKSFCEIGEWRLLGFDGISSFAVSTVKETGCISLYWGVIVFFLPYRFGGVGERGMVLLHVNDPPFFTTPCGILQEAKRCKKMVSHFPWNLAEHILGIRIISYTFVYYNTSLT